MSIPKRLVDPIAYRRRWAFLQSVGPGVLLCAIIALAAQFLSEHYGAPAMLMALLIGMSVSFLNADDSRASIGITFTSKKILRIGVALLGARIGLEAFSTLGLPIVFLVVGALILTMAFGFVAAKFLGRGWRLAILSAGAVSICGASAAMAISAVLPKNEFSDRNLSFVVFGVTLLSTIAMVVYPIIAQALGLSEQATGIFFGATIHDVAQVVGAGFAVSEVAGETATTVKLVRVSLLAPFVLILTLAMRAIHDTKLDNAKQPPLIPGFIIGFLVLATANSIGILPPVVQNTAAEIAQWAMLFAIAAVGIKTNLRRMTEIPNQSVALLILETLFIAAFALLGLYLIDLYVIG